MLSVFVADFFLKTAPPILSFFKVLSVLFWLQNALFCPENGEGKSSPCLRFFSEFYFCYGAFLRRVLGNELRVLYWRCFRWFGVCVFVSGTKKEPKPKLLSPDIFWWVWGLPREGVGAKKFGMSLETQGIKLFWRDIPGFGRDIPETPEKFEKKCLGSIFGPYCMVF